MTNYRTPLPTSHPSQEPAEAEARPTPDVPSTPAGRPRLLVLGSGWGASMFIKGLPADIKYGGSCWVGLNTAGWAQGRG